jgi:hypothetical protein
MAAIGQHRAHLGPLRHLGDHRRVGGHHQLVGEIVLSDPLNDAGDEWLAGQELQRFVGESGGA